ncbi:LPXTG cell wall anchor domain-containing protein, partial [Actinomyces sp. W5033]|uniref:LPXTG cell wall anchor domain-containing protein n=1 Tax=Actinomyces sp. W5033 TaxID=3446479 RepID=UPI003EE13689
TIADKDTVVALTATNTYTPVPTPSPTPSRPGRPLARTGASNVLVLGVLGSVLVAAGGVVVALRRRREQA